MANRPIDDFDPRNPQDEHGHEQEAQEPIDDEADFGGTHTQSRSRQSQAGAGAATDIHDDADFIDDDMNDIVDDADPMADDYDEHDHDDHDSEDAGHDEDAHAPEAAPSRFSLGSALFYIIIAGVIAGGGYMAYRTFMTGGEPVSPGTMLQAAGNAASDVAGTAKGVVVPTDANAPVPAPMPADNSNPVPSPMAEANNSNWQTTLSPETAAVQPAPLPAPMPTPVAVAVPATPAGAPAAPLAAMAANTEAMAGLNARLADTESRLAAMTANVATLNQTLQASQAEVATLKQRPAPAAAVTAPPSDTAEAAMLRTQNGSLQKKVAQLTQAQQTLQTQLQAANNARTSPAARPVVRDTVKEAKISPKAVTAATAQRDIATNGAAGESAVGDDMPRSPKTRVSGTGKSNWVLRAATPGMAWVSPQPGSAELKRVVPGDQLAGIGQITAIRQENGRWIVEGSNGTVR